MKTHLRVELLESREIPSATVESPSEAYSWVLLNEMRSDPAGFANRLDGLRRGTIPSAFGFSKNDPVVGDLKRLLSYSTWPGHYGQALQMLRAAPAVGPLGWDDVLEERADVHSQWMRTHSFEHTAQDHSNKWYIAGFNTGYRGGSPDAWGYEPGRYEWWGEDIGYTYGLMANSKAAYAAGKLGRVGFDARAAFIDTVSYVIEVNSPSMAHLQQLLTPDSGSPDQRQFNAVGMDLDYYEGPYEKRDGMGEATISTHRFGLYRPGGSGGFLSGITYRDDNGNGAFNAGEGTGVTLTVSGPVSYTETLERASTHGVYSRFLPNGTYSVTAVATDGTPLGTRTATISNSNAWFAFSAAAPPTLQSSTVTIQQPTGSVGVRPVISWSAAADAIAYQINLRDETSGRVLFLGTTTMGTTWSPPSDLISGHSYRITVRALLAHQNGVWSAKSQLTVATPVVTGPGADTPTLRPTFTWSHISGATEYEVRVNNLSTGKSNVVPGQRTTGSSWVSPVDLTSGDRYSVRVRAVNSRGQAAWGPVANFSIAVPTLIGPSDPNAVAFGWSAIAGTTQYVLAIYDHRTGKQLLTVSTAATDLLAAEGLLTSGQYRWRVAALNAAGVGKWSETKAFDVRD
jgi:hypothetical protein